MKFFAKIGSVAALAFSLGSALPANAALIDLGFSLDESGSIGIVNFNLTRDALASALALIPTSGTNQYRVAVTSFSDSSRTIIPPTIVTAGNIGGLQTTLGAAGYIGSTTATDDAIRSLTALFTSATGGLGDTTLINITTDGSPNDQGAAVQAAKDAIDAGVDGISFEAVGDAVGSQFFLDQMAAIALPNSPGVIVTDLSNIPDATKQGFVIPVADFAGYQAAIKAKINTVVDNTGGGGMGAVPLPAGLPLLLAGIGAFGVLRRTRKQA